MAVLCCTNVLYRLSCPDCPDPAVLTSVSDPHSFNPDLDLVKFVGKNFLVCRKKITFPPCFCQFILRQCYIITQSAKNFKCFVIFSNSEFSRFFTKFLAKNCHNSVIVRGYLTIPTDMGS
jgi:hypothetical protein